VVELAGVAVVVVVVSDFGDTDESDFVDSDFDESDFEVSDLEPRLSFL
jgi:hypothetical protein